MFDLLLDMIESTDHHLRPCDLNPLTSKSPAGEFAFPVQLASLTAATPPHVQLVREQSNGALGFIVLVGKHQYGQVRSLSKHR